MRKILTKILGILFPPNTARRKILKKYLVALRLVPKNNFYYYSNLVDQSRENLSYYFVDDRVKNSDVLISIVIPMYNTPKKYLYPLVYSVISQSYEKWELILVNACNDDTSRMEITSIQHIDSRIKVIETVNKGISANTNVGIKSANGKYVAFSDHDDELDVNALYEVVKRIIDHPNVDLIYSDEDKLSEDGQRYTSPHFKPDWSPNLLTRVNYVTHLVVVKKSLINKVGLLDTSKDGAQDYDLLLRIADTNPNVIHIPKILYHWRIAENSTASDFSAKENITAAGVLSLNDHFRRLEIEATAIPKNNRPGYYDIKYRPIEGVSVIISPFADEVILALYLKIIIKRTNTLNLSKIIIPEGVDLEFNNITIVRIKNDKNYLANSLKTAGQYAVVINQVLFPKESNWLEELSGLLRLRNVSTASPVIVNKDDVIEDMGEVEVRGEYRSLFKNAIVGNNLSFFGVTEWERNVAAIRGSIVIVRTDEILTFMNNHNFYSTQTLLRDYSISEFKKGLFNTVLPNVKFTRESLNIYDNIVPSRDMYNVNLIDVGPSTELKTPYNAAIRVLTLLNEELSDNKGGDDE